VGNDPENNSSGAGQDPAKIDIKQMAKQPPCLGVRHWSFPSHLETLAEVELAADGIVD
jgi:hypothetical protein